MYRNVIRISMGGRAYKKTNRKVYKHHSLLTTVNQLLITKYTNVRDFCLIEYLNNYSDRELLFSINSHTYIYM